MSGIFPSSVSLDAGSNLDQTQTPHNESFSLSRDSTFKKLLVWYVVYGAPIELQGFFHIRVNLPSKTVYGNLILGNLL